MWKTSKNIIEECACAFLLICYTYSLHNHFGPCTRTDSHYTPTFLITLSLHSLHHFVKLRYVSFYRAMHFSAKRGIAIACRLSVCLSVRPSVTLVNCDHIGWNSSKIISPLVSLGRSIFATPTRRVCSKGNTPKFSPE